MGKKWIKGFALFFIVSLIISFILPNPLHPKEEVKSFPELLADMTLLMIGILLFFNEQISKLFKKSQI